MKNEQITFDQAMKDLEEVVMKMEQGKIPLEQSMDLFRKGVELTKICKYKLDEAEKEIKILIEQPDGAILENEFSER